MNLSSPNWAFVHMDTDHFKNHPVIQAWVWFWRLSPWISPRPTESWLPIEVHWLPTTQRFPATQAHKLRPTYSTFWQACTHRGAHHPDEHKAYYCVIHGRCHQRPGPAQPPPRLPSTHIHLPLHQVQCHRPHPSSMSLSYSLGSMSPSLIRLQVIQLSLCHLGRTGIVVVPSLQRLSRERCKKTKRGKAKFFWKCNILI